MSWRGKAPKHPLKKEKTPTFYGVIKYLDTLILPYFFEKKKEWIKKRKFSPFISSQIDWPRWKQNCFPRRFRSTHRSDNAKPDTCGRIQWSWHMESKSSSWRTNEGQTSWQWKKRLWYGRKEKNNPSADLEMCANALISDKGGFLAYTFSKTGRPNGLSPAQSMPPTPILSPAWA